MSDLQPIEMQFSVFHCDLLPVKVHTLKRDVVLVFRLLYVAFRCLGPAGCINYLFYFPYPCFPPTAQCFDSQLYRVCKGGGPVWLLPEGRMETRQLHDSCSGKHTSPTSYPICGLITLITCAHKTKKCHTFNWRFNSYSLEFSL